MNPLIYNSENLHVNYKSYFFKIKIKSNSSLPLICCSWNFKFEECVCRPDTQCHAPNAALARKRRKTTPPNSAPEFLSAVILSQRRCYD